MVKIELTEAEARELKRITEDTILSTPPSEGRDILVGIVSRLEQVQQ